MADDLDDAREGQICTCGHLGKRHLGVRGEPLHACLDCRTCERFSVVADDLGPATVERAARAAFIASDLPEHQRYAEQHWDNLPPSHGDREKWARIVRAALGAARDDLAPTVTAEQVERLARQRADDVAVARGIEPWSDDSWAHVRHDLIRDEAARLRKAGIEVREP